MKKVQMMELVTPQHTKDQEVGHITQIKDRKKIKMQIKKQKNRKVENH